MGIRNYAAVALVLASAILAGCATSRSEVKLTSPSMAALSKAAPNGRTVVIRAINDDRVFEQAPDQPSTPSLGSGGVAQASDSVKARAIARKRNTYGQALGDVLLQDGQTVIGVVRENLTSGFEQAGYRVASAGPAAGPTPITLDVSIRKFWAWMRPGFWALTFNANIETVLAVSGGASTTISVSAQDSGQIATDDAWTGIVQKALADYQSQAVSKLSGPPF